EAQATRTASNISCIRGRNSEVAAAGCRLATRSQGTQALNGGIPRREHAFAASPDGRAGKGRRAVHQVRRPVLPGRAPSSTVRAEINENTREFRAHAYRNPGRGGEGG